ncbi:MAG: flagellar FlbD family protein [Lachnospiraceae bacterium]|nr:flagellar FlbD family protein [Lachnospiraceae bacterium]
MINITKLNDVVLTINPDFIEVIEETPDTVITMSTGRKIIVKESRQEIINLVKSYRRDISSEA